MQVSIINVTWLTTVWTVEFITILRFLKLRKLLSVTWARLWNFCKRICALCPSMFWRSWKNASSLKRTSERSANSDSSTSPILSKTKKIIHMIKNNLIGKTLQKINYTNLLPLYFWTTLSTIPISWPGVSWLKLCIKGMTRAQIWEERVEIKLELQVWWEKEDTNNAIDDIMLVIWLSNCCMLNREHWKTMTELIKTHDFENAQSHKRLTGASEAAHSFFLEWLTVADPEADFSCFWGSGYRLGNCQSSDFSLFLSHATDLEGYKIAKVRPPTMLYIAS